MAIVLQVNDTQWASVDIPGATFAPNCAMWHGLLLWLIQCILANVVVQNLVYLYRNVHLTTFSISKHYQCLMSKIYGNPSEWPSSVDNLPPPPQTALILHQCAI